MNRALRPLAAIIPLSLGYYLLQVHRHVTSVKPSTVTVLHSAPPSFLNSKAYSIVNPKGHVGLLDTRTIVIELPPSKACRSNEQILAEYIEAFFGGWVFTPERLVLQALHRRMVNFSGDCALLHTSLQ